MAETLLQYQHPVIAADGTPYEARACGGPMGDDGMWQGWIEFVPLTGGELGDWPVGGLPRGGTRPRLDEARRNHDAARGSSALCRTGPFARSSCRIGTVKRAESIFHLRER